jgi:hypothetical protein
MHTSFKEEVKSMIKQDVQYALLSNLWQRVHLISGETYTGVCKIDHSSDALHIETNKGNFTVPYWTIKRFV